MHLAYFCDYNFNTCSMNLLRFCIFLLLSQLFFSCGEKTEIVDPPPQVIINPDFDSISISGDNKTLTLFFTRPVYKGGVLNQPIDAGDLLATISGGQAVLDSISVNHTAGDSIAVIKLFTSGFATGEELLTLKPSANASIVDAKAIPMRDNQEISVKLADIGLIGEWLSTGADLSPLFQSFGFDSVYFNFKPDGTYSFRSRTTGGIQNLLSGDYEQNKSGTGDIRLIRLLQKTPVNSVIEGIFAPANGNPVSMTFETVQTQPAITGLTAPTPEAGFGSSGLIGSDNTQVFVRLDKGL